MILRLLSLLLVLVLASCTASRESSVASSSAKVLRVGVSPDEPPLIYKSGGKISGIEADFAHLLARRLGAQVKFVEMPFDRLLKALDADKIDIVMSGMTVTELRTPLAEFCDPYMASGQMLMVRDKDLWTYSYPEVIFLIKTRIGVDKGSVAEALVQRRCPNATIQSYGSTAEAARALKAGEVDVVISDAPVILRLVALHPNDGMTAVPRLLARENLAWAVARGDTEMLTAGNDAIRQWRTDGTLDRVLRSYLNPQAQ